MPFIHKQLAAGRWFTLSYAEQLGNIGSEVERTIRALETENPERKVLAFARALDLLDLTLADPRWWISNRNSAGCGRPSAMSSRGKTPPAPPSNLSDNSFWSGR